MRFGILRRDVNSHTPTITDNPITIPATAQLGFCFSSKIDGSNTGVFSGVTVGNEEGAVVVVACGWLDELPLAASAAAS